jgi:hypothetical protein
VIRSTLRHFALSEFRHPELVDDAAAVFLDDVRDLYGGPLIVTSDARTPEENTAAPGHSPTSLHLVGRAFDLRWLADPEALWRFVDAVYVTAGERSVELELVHGPRDQHLHVGLYPNGAHRSRLLIRAD